MKEALESGKALQRALAEPVQRRWGQAAACPSWAGSVCPQPCPRPPLEPGSAFMLGISDMESFSRPASPLGFFSNRIVLDPLHCTDCLYLLHCSSFLSAFLGPTAVSGGGGSLYFASEEARTFSGTLICPWPRRKHLALGLCSY